MRKFTKGLLIISLLLFLIGAGCLITGLVMGIGSGDLRNAVEKYVPFLDFEQKNIVIDKDIIELPFADNYDTEAEHYTFEKNEVTQMELNLSAGNFVIYSNNTDQIVIDASKSSDVKVSFNNGTLDIENDSKIFGNNNEYLEIYLPSDLELVEFELQTGAGNVIIESPIQAENVVVELGASVLTMTGKMTAETFSLEVGAGKASIDYLDAKKIDLENGVGQTIIGLAGQKDQYNVTIESAVGTVQFGDERFTGLTEGFHNQPKDAGRFLQIESALGEIDITFKEEI